VSVSGGTAPYTYVWGDGPTTQDRAGLAAGPYSLVVTDANGCTANVNVTITEPTALVATETHVNVSCFGGSNGSIDVSVSGGAAPYTYVWGDGPTTQDRGGLAAGAYSLVVTDANGCTANVNVTITQPTALVATETHVNVSCFGGTNGSIDVSVSGGTAPYTYLWSDGPTTQDRAGLAAGPYSLVVTDANGCTANVNVTITQPTALVATETHVNVSCFGGTNGSIDVSVSGGTAPYTYLWGDGPTTQDRGSLAAGAYSLVVTDANGCTANVNVTITQPTALLATETHTDACQTSADGTIDVSVSGGTPPYTYLWGDGPTTQDRSALAAGPYSLVVTDANGCTANVNVTIGLRTYTITASAGPNGTIAPSGAVGVTCGSDQAFVITANAGYHVLDVVVDSGSQGPQSGWTFLNVQANHSISVTFQINPAVAPVANLVATQVRTGNPAGSVTRIGLTWDATPVGTTVEVWRASFGHYPEYDEAGGAVPAVVPAYPPGGPWAQTGVTTSGTNDSPATRDFYYYVAYAKDTYGTWSTASNRTAGTLNYHLGDVSDGFTIGTGNNQVYTEDISLLGAHYGASGPALAPFSYLDVGPTTTFYIDGRPTTDRQLDFEDLVMFAINHNQVSAPGTVDGPAAAKFDVDAIRVEAPAHVAMGDAPTARLVLRGSGALRALSTRLEWNKAVVEPVDHVAGQWLAQQNGVAFAPAPGAVDAAVFGAEGMSGEGEVATVNFRVIAPGDPGIRIASVDGRDANNQHVAVMAPGTTSVPVTPRITQLAQPRPNPFVQMATISFSLSTAGPVQLTVFSVDGRKVRTLANDVRDAGDYSVLWDGRDDHGSAAVAGVYYVHLSTKQSRFTRTVVYVK
jgi:hypothetical protein